MSCVLILLLSASVMYLAKGKESSNCEIRCSEAYHEAFRSNSEPIVCRAAQTAVDCLKSCGIEGPVKEAEDILKRQGFTCHLSGSSTVFGSLLPVLGALMVTAYRALTQ